VGEGKGAAPKEGAEPVVKGGRGREGAGGSEITGIRERRRFQVRDD